MGAGNSVHHPSEPLSDFCLNLFSFHHYESYSSENIKSYKKYFTKIKNMQKEINVNDGNQEYSSSESIVGLGEKGNPQHFEKLTGADVGQRFYKSDMRKLIEAIDQIRHDFPAVNATALRNMILSGQSKSNFDTTLARYKRKGYKFPSFDYVCEKLKQHDLSWLLPRNSPSDTLYPRSLKADFQSFDFVKEAFSESCRYFGDLFGSESSFVERATAAFLEKTTPENVASFIKRNPLTSFLHGAWNGKYDHTFTPGVPRALFVMAYSAYNVNTQRITQWEYAKIFLFERFVSEVLLSDELSGFAAEAFSIIFVVFVTEFVYVKKNDCPDVADFQAFDFGYQFNVCSQIRELYHSVVLGDVNLGLKSLLVLAVFGNLVDQESLALLTENLDLKIDDKLDGLSVLDHLSNVESLIGNIAESYAQTGCFKTSIMSVVFRSDIFQQTRELLKFRDRTYTGVHIDGFMHYLDLYAQLKDQLKLLTAFKKRRLTSAAKRTLVDLISEVELVLAQLELKKRGNSRPFPFGVVLVGSPGIGKSAILDIICVWWGKVKGKKFLPHHRYQRTKGEKFWSGYDTQDILHIGEVGNVHKDIAVRNGDEDMAVLNSIMSTEPYCLPQADLSSKGNSYANFGLVTIDTNNEEMHLRYTMSTPSAMERRFTYIRMEVRDEFRMAGSSMIDPIKSLEAPGNKLDRYYFDVVRKPPGGVEKVLARRIDIYALRTLMMSLFKQHIEVQDKTIGMGLVDIVPDDEDIDQEVADFQAGLAHAHPLEAIDSDDRPPVNAERADFQLGDTLVYYTKEVMSFFLFTYLSKYSFTNLKAFGLSACCATELVLFIVLVGLYFGIVSNFIILCSLLMAFVTMLPAPQSFENKVRRYVLDDALRLCKDRVFEINKGRLAMCLVGISAFCYFYTKRRNKKDSTLSGDAQATTPFKNDTQHSSYLNEFEKLVNCELAYKKIPNKLDVNLWMDMRKPLVSVKHTTNPSALVELCKANTRLVAIHLPTGFRVTHILGVRGQFALVNTHALADCIGSITLIKTRVTNFDVTHPLNEGLNLDQVQDIGNDVSVVRLSRVNFRDITKHIVTEKAVPSSGAVYTFDGKFRYTLQESLNISSGAVLSNVMRYDNYDQRVGYCGKSVVIPVQSGYQIAGFHAAGLDSLGSFAVLFDQSSILKAIDSFTSFQSFSILSEPLVSPYVLSEPNQKSLFRYNTISCVDYLGSLPGNVILESASRLKKSIYTDGLMPLLDDLRLGNYELLGKPVLRPVVRNGKYLNPYTNNLVKMDNKFSYVPDSVKSTITEFLVKHLVDGLTSRGVCKLSPLTFDEAVNGGIEDPFIRRVNPSTGAGFPLSGKKARYIPIVEETAVRVTREPTEPLQALLQSAIEKIRDGSRPFFVFTGHLKDEPRASEKVRDAKTRLFYSSEFAHLILSRQFFAPFYSLMTEHGDLFCSAVGVNMFTGVDRLLAPILKFRNNCNEGDYKSYDITTPFFVSEIAYDVRYRVLKHFGYNDDALQVVNGLTTEDLFPVINVLNDLFVKPGLQPSGKGYTAEDNSLKNLIMSLLCWHLSGFDLADYFRNVSLTTLGDDILFSVSDDYKDRFNSYTYQLFCAQVLKMEFTASDKSDSVLVNAPIEKCTFLKRNFIWNSRLLRWIAPLHPTSILKTLYWYIPSNSVTKEEQMKAMATSALYEVYLHFVECESSFDRFRRHIVDKLVASFNCDLETLNEELPRFGDIRARLF